MISPICKILGCVDVWVVLVNISMQEKVKKYTLGSKTNWDKGLFEKINDVILISTSSASHLGDEWATLNEVPK
jgi:hypothetical protein